MKLLYIVKSEVTETLSNMLDNHKKGAKLTVIHLRENKNYKEIIQQVFANDKIITW